MTPLDSAGQMSSQESQSPGSATGKKTVRKSFLKSPKAADLKPQVQQRAAKKDRAQVDAPIHVQICRYTRDASLFVHTFPVEPMWQVQVVHDAIPSVTFDLVRQFNGFLAGQHAANPRIPGSLADLYSTCDIKLVLTDSNDPDGVGFVMWRVAFYVAGPAPERVDFTINLLDNFFAYRKQTETVRPFPALEAVYTVATTARYTVQAEHFELPSTVTNSDDMRFPFTAAAPPFGRRVVCCVIDIEDNAVSAVISGNTWPFRAALDAAGIGGDYGPADEDGHREYYRVMPSQAMDEFDLAATLDNLFKGTMIVCSVRETPAAESAGAEYVKSLKEQSHLYFPSSIVL